MFYDNFVNFCAAIGKTPSAVVTELGISKSNVTYWKKDRNNPSDVTLAKIAEYFNIAVEELTGEKEKPTGNSDGLSEEEIKFIEWYRSKASEKEKALVRMIVEGEN